MDLNRTEQWKIDSQQEFALSGKFSLLWIVIGTLLVDCIVTLMLLVNAYVPAAVGVLLYVIAMAWLLYTANELTVKGFSLYVKKPFPRQ